MKQDKNTVQTIRNTVNKHTYYQNTHTYTHTHTHPHITKHVETNTVQDIPKWNKSQYNQVPSI